MDTSKTIKPRTFVQAFYTGIGSRQTPDPYLDLMTKLASRLAADGWILRSGGAPGADMAFENGAPSNARSVYLPWRGFNENSSNIVPEKWANWAQAQEIASRHHPAWDHMERSVRALMTRNVYQLLGDDLKTPSRLVLCWAPKPKLNDQGCVINTDGGTGLAVRLAASYGVPVYHLGIAEHMNKMCSYLGIAPLDPNLAPKPKTPKARISSKP
jgi:hypothetical protein